MNTERKGKIDDIITDVIRRESPKYTNNPKDSGGPTKFGITQATLASYRGRAVTAAEVAALTEGDAREIYRHKFIAKPGYLPVLELSVAIGEEVVDTGVNAGPARATSFLQEALNGLNRNQRDYSDIAEDGICGPATVRALRAYLAKRGKEGEVVLLRALNALQGAYYIDLARRRPKDEEFLYGWLRTRVA